MPESLSYLLRLCRLPRLYAPGLPYLHGIGFGRLRHPVHRSLLHGALMRYPCGWPRWQWMSGSLARSLRQAQAQALQALPVARAQPEEPQKPIGLGWHLALRSRFCLQGQRPFRRFQLVVGRVFLQPRWRRCAPAYCLFPLRQMQAVACCLLPRDPPVWRAALHPHVQALLHVAVQTVDGGRAYRRHQACRALPELGAALRQALLLSGEREFLRPCKLPGTGRSAPSLAQCAIDRPRFCTRYRNWGNG